MQILDWLVIAIYCLISLGIGVFFTKKATGSVESYFASGRSLGWLLAGTSMAATAFSSDTPLLVTGIVRQKGIWGNWEIWALSISTMLTVFFFSKLWKRAGVLTEVELVEIRYSGRPAAFLRGFKAIYWGILYNAFIMGAWPVTGLTKVMQETTGWSKIQSILFCMGLTAFYSTLSGYWGVVFTDLFQFIIAMAGATILAVAAVQACGGLNAIVESLGSTSALSFVPPLTGQDFQSTLASPFAWFLSLIFIQWWAWKNTDGGGIIVQRIVSCRNEKQATYATLWFNFSHYALRSWPWIITALASLVLIPELTDHERAYPKLITMLLPAGFRGFLVASFFAAFMSTMSTHLNWGSSYFVNDFYRRFIKKAAIEKHYVRVGQLVSFILAALATIVAFYTESIGRVFTFILNLTAAIGPVYLLRWFWWRINPWSEIAAMVVSVPVILARPYVLRLLGLQDSSVAALFVMIIGSAIFWLPLTLFTKPVEQEKLKKFYDTVKPPGFWKGWQKTNVTWVKELRLWLSSTVALLATTIGPLQLLLGNRLAGLTLCSVALILWLDLIRKLQRGIKEEAFQPAKTEL